MRANQLLLAAILASAIGSPIVAFGNDKRVVQQMKRAAVQLPIEAGIGHNLPQEATQAFAQTRPPTPQL